LWDQRRDGRPARGADERDDHLDAGARVNLDLVAELLDHPADRAGQR
jgi:hypothetical protein